MNLFKKTLLLTGLLTLAIPANAAPGLKKNKRGKKLNEIESIRHSPVARSPVRHAPIRRPPNRRPPMQLQRLRLQIPMYAHLRGQNLLRLKRLAKRQYPHLRLNNYDLKRVKIVGKSKRGRAQATLLVNNRVQDVTTIDGGYEYAWRDPRTNYRSVLVNYERGSYWNAHMQNTKMQLSIRGNVKLKKIVLIMEEKPQYYRNRPPHRRYRPIY